MEILYLETPANFSFKSTVYSHGWADLKPFQLTDNPMQLTYVVNLAPKVVKALTISDSGSNKININSGDELQSKEKDQVKKIVTRMFRLDEDYDEFYELASKSDNFSWVLKFCAGRMLRCGNLWEDMVKMLCTTNCTWRLTQIMTENLTFKLGSGKNMKSNEEIVYSFPQPADIANQTEDYLRNEIKMGYRAPYLLEFSRAIVNGEINLEAFEDNSIETGDLYKKIRNIKGFGDYAVSNLLKLLGRYDFLGADSWSRQKFFDKHKKGKSVSDKKIYSHYNKYGKWAGLFFWMDVSEDWYMKEIPW
jgi:N-glycosylase/DNA lyase